MRAIAYILSKLICHSLTPCSREFFSVKYILRLFVEWMKEWISESSSEVSETSYTILLLPVTLDYLLRFRVSKYHLIITWVAPLMSLRFWKWMKKYSKPSLVFCSHFRRAGQHWFCLPTDWCSVYKMLLLLLLSHFSPVWHFSRVWLCATP